MTDLPQNGSAEKRRRLVAGLRASGALHDDRVEAALSLVPRHVFLPQIDLERAYADDAVLTKLDADGHPISSSSQPAIMALMLEQLDVRPGQRVLEIGAGTGYNAACLACLTGDAGLVTTVEIDDDLAIGAREHLAASGFGEVSVVCGDGGLGWPPGAPYDRIIATAGAWDIMPAWTSQLAPGGRLVLPLALSGALQYSVAFEAAGDHLASVSILPCGFMRLRGAFAGPETVTRLGDHAGLLVEDTVRPPGAEDLAVLLAQPGRTVGTGVQITGRDLYYGLALWLVTREPTGLGRMAYPPPAPQGPCAARPAPRRGSQILLTSAHGCATVEPVGGPPAGPGAAFEAGTRPYGSEGFQLAERLAGHIRDWDAAGRPSPADARIGVYPEGTALPAAAGATVIAKPHTRLVLTWRDGGS
jgi:protein-L-isoaspartate(D-aspartate) O-methyltransferase